MNIELLTAIRDALRNQDEKSEALWNVLTALRGPDNENGSVKEATTQVIRHRFLGRGPYEYGSMCGSLVCADSPFAVATRKDLEYDHTGTRASIHFIHHAKKAFAALGLKWDELNP